MSLTLAGHVDLERVEFWNANWARSKWLAGRGLASEKRRRRRARAGW